MTPPLMDGMPPPLVEGMVSLLGEGMLLEGVQIERMTQEGRSLLPKKRLQP